MEGILEENFLVERLREGLLALGPLLQRLDEMLPPQTRPPPGTPPPPAPDQDLVFRLLSVLVVVVSLAGLIYYVFFRGGECGVGGWGATRMLMKPPRGVGKPTLYEHKSLLASIALLALIVLSLGGLYYYYCYQAGCFGDGGHATVMVDAPGGRKLQMMSR